MFFRWLYRCLGISLVVLVVAGSFSEQLRNVANLSIEHLLLVGGFIGFLSAGIRAVAEARKGANYYWADATCNDMIDTALVLNIYVAALTLANGAMRVLGGGLPPAV